MRSQYFYGWENNYPPQKDVQLEINILYTMLDVWDTIDKKKNTKKDIKMLRNVPFSCILYLYLFALFSLLYFVCTHSITAKCYIKNMNMNN